MKTADKEAEAFAFYFVDILQGPIMTYTTEWADCIPQRLIRLIKMARLVAGMKKEELATLPEVSAYMITRTFLAPMDNDWTQIYTFVSCKVCEEHFGEDHWAEICPDKKLNDYQKDLLLRLRRWIYEKRQLAVKKKMKAESQAKVVISKFVNEPYNF